MFEFVQNLVLANPLELYTAVIATIGVAFWAIDRRSMKAQLNAFNASDLRALRLERQKVEAGVERSLVTLQMKCQATRDVVVSRMLWKFLGGALRAYEESVF